MDKKLNFETIKNFCFYPELVLLASFLFSILNLNLIQFDSKMSLHLARVFEWVQLNPSSWRGPEVADLSFRLVGPFYYWLTGFFWSFTQTVEGVLFVNILFSYICFYLLIKELKRNLNTISLTIWAFFVLLTPLIFTAVRQLESSSLLAAFSSLIFVGLLKYEAQRRTNWIWFTLIITLFAIQIHLAIMVPCLAFVAAAFFKSDKKKMSSLFCSVWLILGVAFLPLTKEIHFLILPSSLLLIQIYENFLLPKPLFKYSFLVLTLISGLFSLSQALQNHFNPLHTGRVLSAQGLTSKMTLKLKKFIYSLSTGDATDPFTIIHGRAANQMRREEMNSSQTETYYGLYQSLYKRKISYDRSLIEKRPDSSWLFQLRNHHELAIGAESPFLMTEIKPQSLPQNTVIKYLNEKSQGVEKVHWNNSNLILPFAFLTYPAQTKTVRLEFQINSDTDKYLNLLMDSEENYKLLQVKFNSKVQAALEHYPGNSIQQSQYIYKIPENIDQAKVVVELKVLTDALPNYSRLDIFTSGYLLASEF